MASAASTYQDNSSDDGSLVDHVQLRHGMDWLNLIRKEVDRDKACVERSLFTHEINNNQDGAYWQKDSDMSFEESKVQEISNISGEESKELDTSNVSDDDKTSLLP